MKQSSEQLGVLVMSELRVCLNWKYLHGNKQLEKSINTQLKKGDWDLIKYEQVHILIQKETGWK